MTATFTELGIEYMNNIQTNEMESKLMLCCVCVLSTISAIGTLRVGKSCNL